jgi:hypothetical protein
MPKAKGSKNTVTIRGINVKKAMICGAVFFAIMGLVAGILAAIPIMILNFGLAILTIISFPVMGAICGGISAGVLALAHNLAVQVSDGCEIEVDID